MLATPRLFQPRARRQRAIASRSCAPLPCRPPPCKMTSADRPRGGAPGSPDRSPMRSHLGGPIDDGRRTGFPGSRPARPRESSCPTREVGRHEAPAGRPTATPPGPPSSRLLQPPGDVVCRPRQAMELADHEHVGATIPEKCQRPCPAGRSASGTLRRGWRVHLPRRRCPGWI
jgi:hypothetical protein